MHHMPKNIHNQRFSCKTPGPTLEKLFDCSVCPKSFKSKQHKSHRAVKNEIVCSICSNTFSKAAIKKHKEEVHYNIRTNKCGTCGQMFHRSSEMKKHMDKLHYLVSFEWNIQVLVQNMFFFSWGEYHCLPPNYQGMGPEQRMHWKLMIKVSSKWTPKASPLEFCRSCGHFEWSHD